MLEKSIISFSILCRGFYIVPIACSLKLIHFESLCFGALANGHMQSSPYPNSVGLIQWIHWGGSSSMDAGLGPSNDVSSGKRCILSKLYFHQVFCESKFVCTNGPEQHVKTFRHMVKIILLKNPYEYASIFSIADPVLTSVKYLYKNKFKKWNDCHQRVCSWKKQKAKNCYFSLWSRKQQPSLPSFLICPQHDKFWNKSCCLSIPLWYSDYGYQTYCAQWLELVARRKALYSYSQQSWMQIISVCASLRRHRTSRSKRVIWHLLFWDLWWCTSKTENYP